MKSILFLPTAILISGIALAAARASSPAPDSLPAQDSSAAAVHGKDSTVHTGNAEGLDTSVQQGKLYVYIAHPALQIITWPVEKGLVPVVKGLIYPTKAPLRYMINENVIDRTIQLISFGEGDRVMLYPILNLAPGTGSFTGLTFRHQALFGRPTEKLVAQGNIYVNGDWKFRTYLNNLKLNGSDFDAKLSMTLTRVKNTSVNQPGTSQFWYYADTSNSYSVTLSHPVPLLRNLVGKASYQLRDNHFGEAPPQEDSVVSDFFRDPSGRIDVTMRGLDKSWVDHILGLGIARDTRNNEHIPLMGSNLRLNWGYHFTNAGHDFHNWQFILDRYFKLGREEYEISKKEERESKGMSMRKVLEKIEYDNLRQTLFNRKVVAVHLYAAQSFEVEGNRMPVYGLQTLGNDTPMRGYSGSRFRDYASAAVSAEYRFPVMRLVDGDIFNEYGVFGRSWDKIDYPGSLKNSWGFGIRVRRPDIYLFRMQLAFHGYQGIQFNMSVDEPF